MKFKRIISMILAIMVLLSGLPIGELVAWGEGKAEITDVEVTKTYRDINNIEAMYIEISGVNLDNLGPNPVIAKDEDGEPMSLSTIEANPYKLHYKVGDPLGISSFSVNQFDYKLDVEMPTISDIKPLNRMVSNDEKITINGAGFTKTGIKVNFYSRSGIDSNGLVVENTRITKGFLSNAVGGPYRLEFSHTKEDIYVGQNFTIKDNYPRLFTLYGELGVSDDITMVPNQGPVNSEVKIKGSELTRNMSVFFLKSLDGSDLYTVDKRGEFVSYAQDVEEDEDGNKTIDVFTVKVPSKLSPGRYYVVLTNDVDGETDLEGKIVSTKTFQNNIFTVIESDDTISIVDVDPAYGPETGRDVTIQGRYIGSLSSNVFVPNANSEFKIGDIVSSSSILEVFYQAKEGKEDQPIGKYRLIGGEDGVDVKEIKREISVQVGNMATFREGSSFSPSVDKLEVRVPSISLREGEDPAKTVYVYVDTRVTYIDPEDGNKEKTISITEEGIWKDKFIFQPISYKPEITQIVPDIIPVNPNNEIAESFNISIIGKNFLKYRYTNEEGERKVKQPVINLANQLILDPNITESQDPKRIPIRDMKVFDDNGNEIDGTPGNDLGSKIIVRVEKGRRIDPNIIDIISQLRVTNPIKNDEDIKNEDPDRQLGLSGEGNIRFVKVTSDETPTIIDVSPDTVTTVGHKGVKITGQNFSERFNLYLDGERVSNPVRNGIGTEIIFDAPPRNEGYVQIMVQNDNGALAVYDRFLYVKTYTDPRIIDFNPKKGTANTLVDLKGSNLVPPNPLVKELEGIGLEKLIGTRVFLDNKDINSYAKDKNGEKTLVNYVTPDNQPLVRVGEKDRKLILADYSHSIILEDQDNEKYYKLYFNNYSGKHLLTDGDRDVYELLIKEGKIHGSKDGEPGSQLELTNKQIEIDGKTLTIKTPYEVEEIDGVQTITGNRVKVLDNNELYFTVPALPREGYYDLAIVNPDANRDERKGQSGFYYFFQPGEKPPKIKEIDPSEGSTEGHYYIHIKGENFLDRGEDGKTSVIIGGVVVAPQDVEVAPDGKSMKVKVPPYPGDLSTETEMDRKHVNVVVTNPDGGSDKLIDGFAYIIPISHPRINRLILNKGSAAGGDIVTIEGSDFRYFEPFRDANNNGSWDEGEEFTDKNYNGEWDDLRDRAVLDRLKQEENGWDELVLPILPTVYFDGKPAEIKSFTSSTIDVLVPKGKSGPVEVYLVNNDYGVSNAVTYTYEASNPRIDSITPGTGRKQGGDRIEILGESFALSQVYMYEELEKPAVEKELVQVGFGNERDPNMSNSSLPLSNPNSGRIRDQKATARAGELEISYDATEATRLLDVRLVENDIEYRQTKIPYQDQEVFLPLNLLKDDEGQAYPGRELVRIKLEIVAGASNTFKLRIDRGFAPEASLANSKQINVTTPSYYTIGRVAVTVINPDGGTATGSFQYKNPDSNPIITNILRDGQEGYQVDDGRTIVEVNYLGGNTIEVIGSDFRRPVRIRIGDSTVIPHNEIEYQPENESVSNRLIFRMPEVDARYIGTYNRLVVENDDGGFASSEPIYLKFFHPESTGLSISRLIPNFGPTEGGTLITIEGRDFRKTMDGFPNGELKVYFGSGSKQVQVPTEDIVSVSFDKILLRTPAYTAGPADIKVENPDGNIAELPNGFHYISNPKIRAVVDPDNDDLLIETLSVEGGERIKIVGSDFMPGARVVFVPVLELLEDQSSAPANSITIDTERYILEDGMEGIEVEVLNGQEILVTSPEGKLDDQGLIVINPDNGATNVYNISYGIPEMGAPLNVEADLVFDQYIRVNWSPVRDAYEYEIYMSENGGQFQFIGSTELTSFVVDRIRPRTQYQFLVRAIGRYGSSKPIDESKSNIVVTGRTSGPKDHDGKPTDRTEIQREGDKANIIIGAKDFTSRGMTIDLTRGELAGVRDVILRIPANIVVDSPGAITILARDYTMKFAPGIFRNSTMEDNRRNSNAGIVFEIASYKGNSNIKPGSSIVGEVYSLKGSYYVGKANGSLDHLNGLLEFNLDYDRLKANNSRLRSINLARYHEGQRDWLPVTRLDRLGLYTIIGSRR